MYLNLHFCFYILGSLSDRLTFLMWLMAMCSGSVVLWMIRVGIYIMTRGGIRNRKEHQASTAVTDNANYPSAGLAKLYAVFLWQYHALNPHRTCQASHLNYFLHCYT